jgi:3'(2'), 5'-bisphosphate nucleotidase
MTAPDQLLAPAAEAVLLAAEVCRTVQHELDSVRALTKDDRSPVTVADYASQAVVCQTLRDHLGDDFAPGALVAEESATFLRDPAHAAYLEATLEAARTAVPGLAPAALLDLIDQGGGDPGQDPFWTLDPIDGTKGFLRGQQYAIALALVAEGTPRLGVLGCPNLPVDSGAPLDTADADGAMYLAVQGGGLEERLCTAGSRASRRLEPTLPPADRPLRACASVEKAHASVTDTDRVLRHLDAELDVLRVDSSAKYALVARGQADAYLRLPTRGDYVERIWDHAAGTVIATEAGCVVSDLRGQRLDFGHGRGLEKNRGVIVAQPRAHERIIRAIEQLEIG